MPPAGALKRSNVEERIRRVLPWVTGGALALLLLGVALLLPEWNLVVTFAGLFAVIIGFALLTPAVTLALMRGVERLARRAGVIVRMAPRTVTRALSRTSVAVAALMVAVSVIIGVGIMIGSFRNTVVQWLDDVLQADIFISPPSLSSNQVTASMAPETAARIAAIPGVAEVATTRGVNVAAFLPDRDEPLQIRLVALSRDIAGENRQYRAAVGDWRATWAAVEAGGIVVNEPMRNRYGVNVGDTLTVQTDRGPHDFPVVGVSVDFDVNAVAFMHDPVYRQFWDDTQISAVGLFVDEGVDVDAMVATLRTDLGAGLGDDTELLVRSNRGTRENALEVFDRTFAITVALQLLATVVAFIGILSTLMSLQLERLREIGVLRATGMTRRQLWRLSLLETGLIGASAGLIAIPTGLVLAVVLIYIINLRSFGWTLQMQLQAGELGRAFLVALGAALLAGLYPAWRMGNIQPADAVRAE